MRWVAILLAVASVAVAQDDKQPQPRTPSQVSVGDQQKALEEMLKRQESRVTIDAKNATIQSIIEEFRKQTEVNIVLDPKNIPDDYRIAEFKVKNAPFREALNHFIKLAQLAVVEETPSVIRIERPTLMSLDVPSADIKDVLSLIAKVSGANIIVAPTAIQGNVRLTVNNVPWNELLDSVVKTLGFATVRERYDIIRIITMDELRRQMETRIFKLKFITPPPSYRASIKAEGYVVGTPMKTIASSDELVKEFAFLKIIEASLTRSAKEVLGSFNYDVATNSLVIRDTKPALEQIAAIIKALDIEPDQVIVGLKFVSTKNEDLLSWGTSWFTIDQLGVAAEGFGGVSRTTPSASPVPGLGTTATQQLFSRLPFGMDVRSAAGLDSSSYFLTEYDTRALFRAFKKDTYTKLLQEPTITVLDNTEATIFVGEEVPYAVTKVTITPGAPTQTEIQEGPKSPVKVGFQLLVIPRILKEENKIILTVIPQNVVLTGTDTSQPGFQKFTLAGLDIFLPRVGQTTILTRLKIDDNQTAVLGGLVVERVSMEDKGLPGLKDIPVINFLFKKREDQTTKERLLIFITPRIVRSSSAMSEALKAKLRLKEAEVERELEELRKSKPADDIRKQIEKSVEDEWKKFKEPPK